MDINPSNRYAKIFGVPRTGTTFVETIFAINFEFGVFLNHYGNKHHKPLTLQEMEAWIEERTWIKDRCLPVLNGVINPLVVIKNPYSWEQSIRKFTKNPRLNLEVEYANYNLKYKLWKRLLEDPYKPFGKGFVIRYEDYLVDTLPKIIKISEETGLKMKNKGLLAGGEYVIPTKVSASDEFTEERRQFYLSGNFGLSKDLIKEITDLVDWKLMEFYGYKKVEA